MKTAQAGGKSSLLSAHLTGYRIHYTVLMTSVRLQLATSISVILYSVASSKSIGCDIFVEFLLVCLFQRFIFIKDTETSQASFVCSFRQIHQLSEFILGLIIRLIIKYPGSKSLLKIIKTFEEYQC